MSERLVVADAGPLIALAKLDRLELLTELFQGVLVPTAVFNECTSDIGRSDARKIAAALEKNRGFEQCRIGESRRAAALRRFLDPGEAEALVLAMDRGISVLMDERKGRREARRLGIQVVGTGAVLVTAKQRGSIDKVAPLLDQMIGNGYRISERLRLALLERCGETP